MNKKIISDIIAKLRPYHLGSEFENVAMSAVYALYSMDKEYETIDTFIESCIDDEKTADILKNRISDYWDTIKELFDSYDKSDLKNIILNGNIIESNVRSSLNPHFSPDSIIKLANKLLDIQENETVLDLCSGSGTFLSAIANECDSCYGIEINSNANEIAHLRSQIISKKFNVTEENALTYRDENKYDKIFSNYPFIIKGADVEECRNIVQDELQINETAIARCSSDWVYNCKIISLMKNSGKAVAVMTNGSASNLYDKHIRKFVFDSGYVETVISLAPKLFTETAIPVTMIVFSKENKTTRLVSAENIFTNERRDYYLSDENINNILNLVNNGGENAIDITKAELEENNYSFSASSYLKKPCLDNGVQFGSIINRITRGSQAKADILDTITSDKPTKYRYVKLTNICDGLIEFEDESQYLTEIPYKMQKFIIPKNSILLSKIVEPCAKSAIALSDDITFVANGNIFIITVDESKANPYYIQSFFDSKSGIETITNACNGSVIKTLSTEGIKKIEIPLPDMDTQNAIADKYIHTLDELKKVKTELKKILDKKKKIFDDEI